MAEVWLVGVVRHSIRYATNFLELQGVFNSKRGACDAVLTVAPNLKDRLAEHLESGGDHFVDYSDDGSEITIQPATIGEPL